MHHPVDTTAATSRKPAVTDVPTLRQRSWQYLTVDPRHPDELAVPDDSGRHFDVFWKRKGLDRSSSGWTPDEEAGYATPTADEGHPRDQTSPVPAFAVGRVRAR